MIEINLLPDELRRAQKTAFNLPREFLEKLIKLGICVLILPIILIPALTFTKSLMLKRVNKALDSIAPQRKQIDRIREESARHKALEKLFSSLFQSRLSVSPKLNAVSDSLPQGLWLDEFIFSGVNWEIKGKCFSASSSEMAQLSQFLNALKSNKDSARAFDGLELGSVQRKKLGPTEIAEWTINSKKPKVDSPVKKKETNKKKKTK
jgi:Tfp pilus assembly protein PilN